MGLGSVSCGILPKPPRGCPYINILLVMYSHGTTLSFRPKASERFPVGDTYKCCFKQLYIPLFDFIFPLPRLCFLPAQTPFSDVRHACILGGKLLQNRLDSTALKSRVGSHQPYPTSLSPGFAFLSSVNSSLVLLPVNCSGSYSRVSFIFGR